VNAIIAAGVACDGRMGHSQRRWVVRADRRVSWRDDDWMPPPNDAMLRAFDVPVPGEVRIVTCDPWRSCVVLADGAVHALDLDPRRPHWTPVKENDMKEQEVTLPYVAGGSGCGCAWTVDSARRLWAFVGDNRSSLAPQPVPGTSPVLACDTTRALVMLATGEMCVWLGSVWAMLPAFGEKAVKVKGTAFGVSTSAGELHASFPALELPVKEAIELIRKGRAVVVTE
jgi:hypothetical protein